MSVRSTLPLICVAIAALFAVLISGCTYPEHPSAPLSRSAVSAKGLPPSVQVESISLSVSAADMETITKSIDSAAQSTELLVPSGTARTFTLAIVAGGMTYTGSRTVDLVAEQNTVVEIVLSLTNTITGISLNKSSLTLSPGETETLSATIEPEDAENVNVVWSSSNSSIAGVNSSGTVTAMSGGNAVIKATTEGSGHEAACTVTVLLEIQGNIDTDFGTNGVVFQDDVTEGGGSYSNNEEGHEIIVDSGGLIYVAGWGEKNQTVGKNDESTAIWRYTSDGVLDTSFNSPDGYVTQDYGAGAPSIGSEWQDRVECIALDASEDIYTAGYSKNSSQFNEMVIYHHNSDGSIDTSFGNNVYAGTYSFRHNGGASNYHTYGHDLVIDGNGKLVIVGRNNTFSNGDDMAVWRVEPDGSGLDAGFAGGGFVTHHDAGGGSGNDGGLAVTLDSSGRIVVAGYTDGGPNIDLAVWRYNTNGTLDTTGFGSPNGYITHNSAAGGNGSDSGGAVTIDGDGKILVAGYSSNGTDNDMAVWRFNDDGSLDTSFNGTGYFTHHNAAGSGSFSLLDEACDIAVDADGRIIVFGHSRGDATIAYDMVIWRLNRDGTLDTTFDSDGWTTHHDAAGGGGVDQGFGGTIDSDGRLLVTGTSYNGSNNDMSIWRYE